MVDAVPPGDMNARLLAFIEEEAPELLRSGPSSSDLIPRTQSTCPVCGEESLEQVTDTATSCARLECDSNAAHLEHR